MYVAGLVTNQDNYVASYCWPDNLAGWLYDSMVVLLAGFVAAWLAFIWLRIM